MSFQGRIEDVAIADVMQLIRLGGHSGTLAIRSDEEALVGFERGRIVSAWTPESPRLGELLVASGAIDEETLRRALQAQQQERPRRTIGQILVRQAATTPEAIRETLTREIERVIRQVLAWQVGTFEFSLDDLTPVVEVTRFSDAPKLDLDTQQVLLEAMQPAESGTVPGKPSEASAEQTEDPWNSAPDSADSGEAFLPVSEKIPVAKSTAEHPAIVEPSASDPNITAPHSAQERPRYQLVSPDAELLSRLNQGLADTGDRISAVALRDAGASLLGEPPPIVVVDLRYQVRGVETLTALCRTRPRASVIALFEGRAPLRDLYRAGVVSITSVAPETVVACMRSVARQRKYLSNEHAIAEGIRASFGRLRRIVADLRSGLLATSVSLNVLNAVAESLDRGVLLVPDRDVLVALGAFGQTCQGEPLAQITQSLAFPVGDTGVFADCLKDSHTRRTSYDEASLPPGFTSCVDRPCTGEIAVLAVPGSERVIALIYLDNGARDRPVGDIEIFELASFQLGLALENEFLRRTSQDRKNDSSLMKLRQTG